MISGSILPCENYEGLFHIFSFNVIVGGGKAKVDESQPIQGTWDNSIVIFQYNSCAYHIMKSWETVGKSRSKMCLGIIGASDAAENEKQHVVTSN